MVARRLPRPAPRQMPGDAECQRVSHFCGAVARARAAQASARAHAAGRDGALGDALILGSASPSAESADLGLAL